MAIKNCFGRNQTAETTMFNALTGANQYVGNWLGVTWKKERRKMQGE